MIKPPSGVNSIEAPPDRIIGALAGKTLSSFISAMGYSGRCEMVIWLSVRLKPRFMASSANSWHSQTRQATLVARILYSISKNGLLVPAIICRLTRRYSWSFKSGIFSSLQPVTGSLAYVGGLGE
jgi:hypothetical protein